MNDEILKRLEAQARPAKLPPWIRAGGRALLGVAAASPLIAFAQAQDKPPADKKKDEPKKKDETKDNEKDAAEDEDRDEGHQARRRRQRISRVSAVRLQHVPPGPDLDLRELRLQLHRIASPYTSDVQPSAPALVPQT